MSRAEVERLEAENDELSKQFYDMNLWLIAADKKLDAANAENERLRASVTGLTENWNSTLTKLEKAVADLKVVKVALKLIESKSELWGPVARKCLEKLK